MIKSCPASRLKILKKLTKAICKEKTESFVYHAAWAKAHLMRLIAAGFTANYKGLLPSTHRDFFQAIQVILETLPLDNPATLGQQRLLERRIVHRRAG